MVSVVNNPKRIATALHGVEEGDEISLVIDGDNARGNVLESRDDIEGHDLEVGFETDGKTYSIYVDYDGPMDHGHFDSNARDYNIFALSTAGESEELAVEAFVDWTSGFDAPDHGIETTDDVDEEQVEEVREEFRDGIDHLERCLTEIQEMRKMMRQVLDGDATLQDYERRLTEMQMESGGRFALDDW